MRRNPISAGSCEPRLRHPHEAPLSVDVDAGVIGLSHLCSSARS